MVEVYVQVFKICNIMKSLNETKAIANLRVWDTVEAANKDTIAKVYAPFIAGYNQSKESLLVDFFSRKMRPEESISPYALDLSRCTKSNFSYHIFS